MLEQAHFQGKMRERQSPLPEAALAAVLPSLRTSEAIVSGEALILPVRALLDKPNPMPLAEDPSLDSWRGEPRAPNVGPPLAAWRGTYKVENA